MNTRPPPPPPPPPPPSRPSFITLGLVLIASVRGHCSSFTHCNIVSSWTNHLDTKSSNQLGTYILYRPFCFSLNKSTSFKKGIQYMKQQNVEITSKWFIGKYLHLPVSSLQWTLIEQLSLFADEDIARLKVGCLATSRIDTNVMIGRRNVRLTSRHGDGCWTSWPNTSIITLLRHVFRLICIESSRKTPKTI